MRGRGRWLAAFAFVEIAVPFPLIAVGEQRVSSSLAAIVVAAAPLFVALLALRFDASERAGGLRLVGLVIGLVGVVTLVGVDVAGSADALLGAAAILAAAFCYAVGPMILKRHLSDLDPRASMGRGAGAHRRRVWFSTGGRVALLRAGVVSTLGLRRRRPRRNVVDGAVAMS